MTRRRWILLGVALVALLLVAGRAIATLYVDYLWYDALGAAEVWRSATMNALLLRGGSAVVGALFLLCNLLAVRHSVVSLVLPRRMANIEIGEEVPGAYLTGAAVVLSVVIGGLLTLPQEGWTTLGLARFGVPFNERDPFFGADVGYFVYWLPLEVAMYVWGVIALFGASLTVIVLYALTPSLRWERGRLHVSGWVRRHLTVLATLLLLVLAWSYRLDAYGAVTDGSGADRMFGYMDHAVLVPAGVSLALVTVAIAILVLWAGWTGQTRVAFGAVSVVLVLSLGLRQALPSIVARLRTPSELAAREAPYVATRAGYTRRAYDIASIRSDSMLGAASAADAARGVSAWDATALRRALAGGSGVDGVPAELAWQAQGDALVAEVLLRPPLTASSGAHWNAVRVAAASAAARGLPRIIVDARRTDADGIDPLPPALVADSVGGYAVVSDSAGVVAAPSLESASSRLAHAWSRQNFRLLAGALPSPSPRMLLRRGVRERVAALAPFFTQDGAVVPAIVGDSLLWFVHLYATSGSYPLSRRVQLGDADWNYVRHAATAVVNARTGIVRFVADSQPDPVAASWIARFPSLFSRWEELGPAVAAASPPAYDAASAQAQAFAWFGSRTEGSTARRLEWPGDDSSAQAPPVVVRGPSGAATVATIRPLASTAGALAGLLVASGGAQSRARWYPVTNGPRLALVREQLRRSLDSASAPGAAGGPTAGREARISFGPLQIVPLRAGDALFAQSAYATRGDGAPTLARVAALLHIAAGGDVVRIGTDVADALGAGGAADSRAPDSTLLAPRAQRIADLYAESRRALSRGDWAAFGVAYDALGRLLGTDAP